MWSNWNLHILLVGNVNGHNQFGEVLEKWTPNLDIYLLLQINKNMSHKLLYANVYSRLFIMASTKTIQCSQIGKRISKTFRNTVQYYTAGKINEVMLCYNMDKPQKYYAIKGVRYKRIFILLFHLYEMSRKGKSTNTKSRWMSGVVAVS